MTAKQQNTTIWTMLYAMPTDARHTTPAWRCSCAQQHQVKLVNGAALSMLAQTRSCLLWVPDWGTALRLSLGSFWVADQAPRSQSVS